MKKLHHVQLSCSFCGKSQKDVKKLVAGPLVYICDECVREADLLMRAAPEGAAASASLQELAHMTARIADQLLKFPGQEPFAERTRALALGIQAAATAKEV